MRARCFFIGTTLADNPVPHHFVALARELVRRGHRVVLLAPHRRTDLEDRVGNPAVYTWPSNRPTKFVDARFLARLIRQYRPSCLIANFVAVNVMTLVGWLAGVRRRIVWYHTMSGAIDIDEPAQPYRTRLLRARKKLVYLVATDIVAVSRAAREDLMRTYAVRESKTRVFLNALADPFPGGPPPRSGLLIPRLLCVGRHIRSKGQDILLRAIARLSLSHPDVRLELVGDGPYLDSHRQLARELGISDRCEFVGRIEHPEVLRRMGQSVATVVSSRSEAFGLVATESLAMGTPIVASAVGGIPEIVRDGVDGFLVPPEDPAALAQKLSLLLSDTPLRERLGRNARQGFLERLEQKRAVAEQADWLEEMVSESSVA